MAATTQKNTIGSAITAITGTALNAMANNALVVGSAINMVQGQAFDGYVWMRVQLTFKFQVAPSTNTGFIGWILKSQDGGTTTEDTAAAPPRPPDFAFLAHPFGGSGDTSAHTVSVDVLAPIGSNKFAMKNDGTGQTLTANNTDNVLSITPITGQMV